MSLLEQKTWCLAYNMCSINICWGNLQTPKFLPKNLISAWNSTWYPQKKTEKIPVHPVMALGGTVRKSPTGHPSTCCRGWLLWGTAQQMTSQRHCTGSIPFSCICLLCALGIVASARAGLTIAMVESCLWSRSPWLRMLIFPNSFLDSDHRGNEYSASLCSESHPALRFQDFRLLATSSHSCMSSWWLQPLCTDIDHSFFFKVILKIIIKLTNRCRIDLQCFKCIVQWFSPIYTHTHYVYIFFRFSSLIGYYKTLSLVLCPIQ